ncbi:MAG: hypothetical protein HY454_02975 [Parcubacteria group bacterium]|nr:hypothetical protein [Parcubacteria group bacterium]
MQLSDVKLRTLSEITRDMGQVFFASVFVGPLVSVGEINWFIVVAGLLSSFLFWFF